MVVYNPTNRTPSNLAWGGVGFAVFAVIMGVLAGTSQGSDRVIALIGVVLSGALAIASAIAVMKLRGAMD